MPHTPGGTEVASVDFGTLRRHHGLWVWLETGTRGLVRFRLGRFGDTVRWVCVVYAGWFGQGCRRSGRFGDTFHLGWMSNLGRTGDTMVRVTGRHRHRAGRLRSGRFCDTMRWLLHIEVWFSTLATLRCAVQGVVQRYQWGVQATLCLCVRPATFADKLCKVLEDPSIVTSAYD